MKEMVNHPDHYQSKNGMEVIDVIEAFTSELEGVEAFDTANVIKYICRWKKKNGVEDLKKVKWYVEHLIKHLEKKKKKPFKAIGYSAHLTPSYSGYELDRIVFQFPNITEASRFVTYITTMAMKEVVSISSAIDISGISEVDKHAYDHFVDFSEWGLSKYYQYKIEDRYVTFSYLRRFYKNKKEMY